MDRVYKIRRASRDMASAYIPGDCHICQQSNVKVRRLKCGMHNFCRMCYEFESKLARGDFTCTICTDKTKVRTTSGNKYLVDAFFSKQTGIENKNTETTVNLDGDKLIEFGNTDDDTDLDGCNTEWDHLLQSEDVLRRDTRVRNQSSPKGRNNEQPKREPPTNTKKVPKKSSYIHLVLPSANTDYNAVENEAAPQPIANTVTQLLDTDIPEPVKSKPSSGSSLNCASLRSKLGNVIITKPRRSLATFQQDPSEIERGSSPCKGLRPQKSYIWCDDDTFSIDPSYSETEQMLEQIGTIEGPAFTSSSCSSSASGSEGMGLESPGSNLGDDGFWD